ncbi:PQQ-binding-like beta-propeller repeat protein [Haloplanus salilacus]|uniref:outer membrane protein assembly factor BamB family protein n=1 Tax=Haloplanus salilacus TaxID=2949994 RepID=UPI0030CC8121
MAQFRMHNPTHRFDVECDMTDHDAATLTTQREFSDTVRGIAVRDGTMYCATGGWTDGGHLYALDRDGTLRWRFDSVAGLAHENGGWIDSSPAVSDETVYVASKDTHVYALERETCAKRWQYQTRGRIASSPAVADGTVYVGSDDAHVYALDATDGTQQWSVRTGNMVKSSPAIVDNTVYVVSDDDMLYALDSETGSERWSLAVGGGQSSPTVVDGTVYVCGYDPDDARSLESMSGALYAVDAVCGDLQWKFQAADIIVTSPSVVGDTVFVSDLSGFVYAVSAKTGTQQWRLSTGDTIVAPPLVRSGTVYIGSKGHGVYAVSADDGGLLWRLETDDAVATVAPGEGRLYVGSYGCRLSAIMATPSDE